jgi:hypothetical protein
MSGAIPPLPNTPPWCGAQLKHRDNLLPCVMFIAKIYVINRILPYMLVNILRLYCVRNANKILEGKPEISLKSSRRRWEENIRMDSREIVWKRVDRDHLTQDGGQWWAYVNIIMNILVRYIAGSFLTN